VLGYLWRSEKGQQPTLGVNEKSLNGLLTLSNLRLAQLAPLCLGY